MLIILNYKSNVRFLYFPVWLPIRIVSCHQQLSDQFKLLIEFLIVSFTNKNFLIVPINSHSKISIFSSLFQKMDIIKKNLKLKTNL